MSRVLMISDDLYGRLESISQSQGLKSIEELLQQSIDIWQAKDDRSTDRQTLVEDIDALRDRLYDKYGEQADSTDLIRADRER